MTSDEPPAAPLFGPEPLPHPLPTGEPGQGFERAPDEELDAPPPVACALADGELRSLAPEHVQAERVGGLVFTGFLALAAGVAILLGWIFDWFPHWLDLAIAPVWLLLAGALARFSWRWPLVEHRHMRWRVDEEGIEIRAGVIWRSVVNVPRSRVQHTDVEQGPVQRRYGLSTLALHTAGTEHAKVSLPGLTREDALAVRNFLLGLPREDDDVV